MCRSYRGRGTKAVYSYVCRSHTLDPLSCPLKNMPESKLMEILWDILAGQFVLTDSLSGQAAVFQNSQRLTKDMVQAVLSRIEIGVGGQVFVELQYQDEYRKLAEFVEQTGRLMA
ncbi:MAG: hypothetical protein K2G51_03545, partial [Lachnospiraceae bacterium]|nr:hypothetical protein [Lachnospiraceae bacterium]